MLRLRRTTRAARKSCASAWRDSASAPSRCARRSRQSLGAARQPRRRSSASPDIPTWCRPARSSSGSRDPVQADGARRRALRPRRGRHEVLDRGIRHRGRAISSPNIRDHPGSIALLITSDEEGVGRRWHGQGGRGADARAAKRIDYCIVGEPSSVRTPRRHHQERPPRIAVRRTLGAAACRATSPIPHLARNPDPPVRAGAGRARRDRMGPGQRILSADHLAGVEHRRRHRRQQCDPGRAEGVVQLPLLHRQHRRDAETVACMPSSTVTGWTTRSTGRCPASPFLTPRGRLVEALSRAVETRTG